MLGRMVSDSDRDAADEALVPLGAEAAEYVRGWLGEPRGPAQLNLHHALADHRTGLWGDSDSAPRCVLLVRERAHRLEVFGAGEPEHAVRWLCRQKGRTVALMAPRNWWVEVDRGLGTPAERVEMQTLSTTPADFRPFPSKLQPRKLQASDSSAFLASGVAVDWALSSWGSFEALVARGEGFVVPAGPGIASAAWVYSQAGRYEAIGVSTAARFRRLGLGKVVASALTTEILHTRGKLPLWTTAPANLASWTLARSLGFGVVATEVYLQWGRVRNLEM